MGVVKTSWSKSAPASIAEDREGNILFATGLHRAQRWRGVEGFTEDVGINAPETSCSIAAVDNSGTNIRGSYDAYVRFIDDEGIASSFSPLAQVEATDASYDNIAYTSIPTSSESRVTERQLWRNTDGQSVTFYLDVEVTDNSQTTATSTNTDVQLQAKTAMRFKTVKGYPNANRFGVPPTNMSVVQFYCDRSWWSVPAEYSEGSVVIVTDEVTVTGTSTNWSSNMVGSQLWTPGGEANISAVNSTTELEMETTLPAASPASSYKILPDSTEYDAVYFSENGEPESVHANNKIVTYPDGDRMTALMPVYGYLFLLKSAHIYRINTCSDPRSDTNVELVAERGCLNHRCWARAEGMAFIIDRQGMYLFNGTTTQSISGPIQDYMRDTINWSASKWFHVTHDKRRELIMFFVALNSDTRAKHVLTFDYRNQRWALESHGTNLHSSCELLLSEAPRVAAGTGDETTTQLLDQGTTDNGSAIAYTLKLGTFKYPETERSQNRRVAIRYTPLSTAETLHLRLYENMSSTARNMGWAHDDQAGVSVENGAADIAFDLTKTEGYLDFRFDGGYEGGTPAARMLDIEITGSTKQAVTLHEIEIDGVEG